jgi:hypothetical protein
MRSREEDIARLFKKSLPSPQQEEEAGKRVFYRLLLARTESSAASIANDGESDFRWKSRSQLSMALAFTAALASLLLFVVLGSAFWKKAENFAHTEPSGDPIKSGASVRTSDTTGKTLRSPSQVQIDHADDGLQKSAPMAQRPAPAEPAVAPQTAPPAATQITREADSLLVLGMPNNGARRTAAPTPETERATEQALTSRELINDLAFVAETNYFQMNRAEYFVPITLKIPGAQLAGSQSVKHIVLDMLGTVIDAYGVTIANFRDAVDVQLSDEKAKELPTRQIAYNFGFTLLPGKYSTKFLVRDGITGRIGTYQTSVVIPNLNREDKTLPISSVVLSAELISLDDVLSNSSQPRSVSTDSEDPLTIEGKKLIPSTTRTFSKTRDLIVFFQAYEPNATATEPLTAFVTLYRGQTKVFETTPLTVKDDLGRRLRTLLVTLRVPLATLQVGAYDCEVTVLDPATQKSAVWRSPITVVN